ncbi:MAG: glycoside hydrolase family 125 protein [Candidatus Eremiobacteraeota bacterium]|nr:glycoside hydrolase family 125 protein [Candidatus Eremiobacteraeota bacterium]
MRLSKHEAAKNIGYIVHMSRGGMAMATLALLASVSPIGTIAAPFAVTPGAQTVAVTLRKIYQTAYDEAYSRHALLQRDGTTFVSTGDINQEWLRDSSAVLIPYIGASVNDSYVRSMLRGAIRRQGRYIEIDPYANAFTVDYRVAERKFEMDSLLYPIWLAYLYWKATNDASVFTPAMQRAYTGVLRTLRTEQHHATASHYRHPELANAGVGSPVAYTGLVWTGFRPSDDAARYQYNIPDNMFAVTVLRDLGDVENLVYRDRNRAQDAWGMADQIHRAVERNGLVNMPGLGRVYAYEIDGRGHANMMDDANIPSLLSIPYFGYSDVRDSAYRATRAFVLSPRNPYFFQGKYAEGIGSPHTPRGYVWPLALVMQALTSTDAAEADRAMGFLAISDTGDHRLHESFNSDWPEAYTRDDFAWPNALFAELMLARQKHVPPTQGLGAQ